MNSRFLVKSERTKTKRENKSAHDPGKIPPSVHRSTHRQHSCLAQTLHEHRLGKRAPAACERRPSCSPFMAGSSFYLLASPPKQDTPILQQHLLAVKQHLTKSPVATKKGRCARDSWHIIPRNKATHLLSQRLQPWSLAVPVGHSLQLQAQILSYLE